MQEMQGVFFNFSIMDNTDNVKQLVQLFHPVKYTSATYVIALC